MINTKVIRPMKSKTKRKRNSAAFKAKIGLEAVIGIKTVAQIAREYSVNPVQVSQWKAVVRERLPDLFESGGKTGEDQEKLIADLHQKIGELTVDLDYLKVLHYLRTGAYRVCEACERVTLVDWNPVIRSHERLEKALERGPDP